MNIDLSVDQVILILNRLVNIEYLKVFQNRNKNQDVYMINNLFCYFYYFWKAVREVDFSDHLFNIWKGSAFKIFILNQELIKIKDQKNYLNYKFSIERKEPLDPVTQMIKKKKFEIVKVEGQDLLIMNNKETYVVEATYSDLSAQNFNHQFDETIKRFDKYIEYKGSKKTLKETKLVLFFLDGSSIKISKELEDLINLGYNRNI